MDFPNVSFVTVSLSGNAILNHSTVTSLDLSESLKGTVLRGCKLRRLNLTNQLMMVVMVRDSTLSQLVKRNF